MLIGDVSINVVKKDIKNLYLKVKSPDGQVVISAPVKIDDETIRQFAFSKLNWIRQKQANLRNQSEKQSAKAIPEFKSGEYHYYQGDRLQLNLIHHGAPPKVIARADKINLYMRYGSLPEQREQVLNHWYRQQLKAQLPGIIAKWEAIIGVKTNDWGVKKMKTRWGTCNTQAKRIWLNLELIKKPQACLEYVAVHELVHLLERNHGDRFKAYMNKFMPNWRIYQSELDP